VPSGLSNVDDANTSGMWTNFQEDLPEGGQTAVGLQGFREGCVQGGGTLRLASAVELGLAPRDPLPASAPGLEPLQRRLRRFSDSRVGHSAFEAGGCAAGRDLDDRVRLAIWVRGRQLVRAGSCSRAVRRNASRRSVTAAPSSGLPSSANPGQPCMTVGVLSAATVSQ